MTSESGKRTRPTKFRVGCAGVEATTAGGRLLMESLEYTLHGSSEGNETTVVADGSDVVNLCFLFSLPGVCVVDFLQTRSGETNFASLGNSVRPFGAGVWFGGSGANDKAGSSPA